MPTLALMIATGAMLLTNPGSALDGSAIPSAMHGKWAPKTASCSDDIEGLLITSQKLEWYEATGFLLLGLEFTGSEGVGFYARLVGSDVDSTSKFWDSVVEMRVKGSAMSLTRLDDNGATVTRIEYKKCQSSQMRPS